MVRWFVAVRFFLHIWFELDSTAHHFPYLFRQKIALWVTRWWWWWLLGTGPAFQRVSVRCTVFSTTLVGWGCVWAIWVVVSLWRWLMFPTQNSPWHSLARLTYMVRSKWTMVAYLIFLSNHLQTDLYIFLTSVCCNASNRLFNLPTYLPIRF